MFHSNQENATATSLAMFKEEKDNNTNVPVEIQEVVYCSGISQGDRQDWDWAYKQYTTTNIPSHRGVILSALACSRDTIVLQEYLDMTLNKDQVRSQDVRTVLGGVASNPSGTLLAWRHLRRHWDKYYDLFGSGSFTLGAIIKGVIGGFSTQFDIEQVEEFFSSRALGAGERALLQAKEHIKVNIMFRESSEKSIVDWINQQTL